MAKILLGNIKGPKGDNGDSAYAVAVNNGFNGTEAEWLESLKGPKGDPGDNELTEDEKQEIIDSLVNESGNMFDIVSSANGSSLHITNSAEANLLGYTLYGNSEKFTTTGANLFDVNTGTLNARINITNGEAYSADAQMASDFISVMPNMEYVINHSYYSTGDYGMAFYDANKIYVSGRKQSNIGMSDATTPFVFTTPANCYYVRFSTLGEPLILHADVTLKPYFQGIKSVGDSGSVETQFTGANLINLPDKTTKGASYVYEKVDIGNIPAGTYTFSCNHNIPENIGWWVNFYDENSNAIGKTKTLSGSVNSVAITTTASAKYITIYVNSAVTLTNIMLNEGSTALPYEPYQSQTYTLPLTEPLRGIGDIRDEIGYARGKRITRFGEVDMGTLNWSAWSNVVFGTSTLKDIIKKPINSNTVANALCGAYEVGDYFTIITSAIRKGLAVSELGSVAIYTETAMTIDEFKSAISGVKLVYELATPIETPLTDEEIAQFRAMHTYDGVTHISTDSIGDIEAEYVRNTKLGKDVVTVVDSKIESNGIVLYKVNPNEKTGIYCNGNTTIDGVNSVLLKDSTKKFKRLKIFARFPYATAIQEFDLTITSLGDNLTYGNRTGGIFVPTADNTEGANSHWFSKLNFAVYESDDGWTFHVIDSGWLGMGIPSVSASDYADGTTTRVNGTEYPHWNQRHNSDYAIYKIVGYMDK